MVVILRHPLYSLFLLPFGLRSVTSFCLIYQLQRPSQNRTCGSPAYGSLASLTCYAYRFIETMCNIWFRQRVSFEIFSKPFPVERLFLTSLVQVFIQQLFCYIPELIDACAVFAHSIVLVMPAYFRYQCFPPEFNIAVYYHFQPFF